MNKYSIKMRASSYTQGKEKHISGAEKIVDESDLSIYADALIKRALHHPKGSADFINLKLEKVDDKGILYLEALPVRTVNVDTYQEGIKKVEDLLNEMGIANVNGILQRMKETNHMRGAMLLDVDTLERLEYDKERGIRVTYMDCVHTTKTSNSEGKNHYKEAIVLATKVAHAPNIIGEICISDDPDYVTGYVACKDKGYIRITKLKEFGNHWGGRIFLYQGKHEQIKETINYLEKQCVFVKNIGVLPGNTDIEPGEKKDKWKYIADELNNLKKNNLYRSNNEIQSFQSTHVSCYGKDMLMLASNNYLDMANDNQVKKYSIEMTKEYGVGSGGSRLTTGTMLLHNRLEKLLAEFKGTQEALVFNSGYMANIGIISALCSKEDVIFSDELNHASIIDGCRLSKAKIVVYSHNDMEDLENKIKENPCLKGLIVSDAVFSMDGDIVDLPNLVKIAEKYGLFSMIDEAHATGVIGETGRGSVEYYHMDKKPDIIMGSLSKAVGSEGGFVCGKHILIEYIKNKSRSFIFSTSLSPAVSAASIKAIELIMEEPKRVWNLHENIVYFCACLRENGIDINSKTAIIPILIGDENIAMKISEELFTQGLYISAIRYPTVKLGSAILRVAIMSTHTRVELKRVADVIGNIKRKYGGNFVRTV